MNIKQKVKAVFTAFVIGVSLVLSVATPVLADNHEGNKCGGVDTAIISCNQTGGGDQGVRNTGLWGVLILAINILTGLVGVAALGGIIYGAILYTSAGGSVEQTKKAMGIIMNVVIGIIAYALMYIGLNFLIPGGVFD